MKRFWIILLFVAWWWPSHKVLAAGAEFTVTPVASSAQIGENTGWFNLLIPAGQKQALVVTVANQAATAKQLHLELTNAYTQDNGQVGYTPNQRQPVNTSTTLTAIGSAPIDVTLAPHTGREVTFQVMPPKAGLAGQLLGAIYVQDRTPVEQTSASGFAVANEFAMVVAVQLQTSTKLPAPKLSLASVKPTTTSLVARIENPSARLLGGITYQTAVTRRGEKTAVLTQRDTNRQMAPNSYFNAAITANKPLAAGDYTMTITATAGKDKWVMSKDFTLSAADAAKWLPPTATAAPWVMPWWGWLLMLIGGVALGIMIGRRVRERKGTF